MSVIMNEILPSAALSPYVEHFWEARFNTGSDPELSLKVVPNGFVELILHISERHCRLSKNGIWIPSPDYTIIGLYTEPYEVRFRGEVKTLGIRIKPEAVRNLFGIAASEFHRQYEDMEMVRGAGFRSFCCKLLAAGSQAYRIDLIEAWLLGRLESSAVPFTYVNHAAEIIRASDGYIRIEDLCSRVYISRRQLEREFRQRTGITPKMYMRIARLNAAHRFLQKQDVHDFSRLAFRCGYADQSHFIRDFREFTGERPGLYVKNRDEYIVNAGAIQ
jgi:AraC-like DNA-binding protein